MFCFYFHASDNQADTSERRHIEDLCTHFIINMFLGQLRKSIKHLINVNTNNIATGHKYYTILYFTNIRHCRVSESSVFSSSLPN